MSDWSLNDLLASLHEDIERRLDRARKVFQHPGTKGDASERVWRELLQSYLPRRYEVATAFVVDSTSAFSEQIDIVVFDRQYSPFVLNYEGQSIVPAESVYAVFESKQSITAKDIEYAHKKILSVRKLKRTSLPIPTATGTAPAKEPQHILGGVLTFDSDWKPALGKPFLAAVGQSEIDIGCCAAHGTFWRKQDGTYHVSSGGKSATAFLLELIARLQDSATVPMIDIRAYANWLTK